MSTNSLWEKWKSPGIEKANRTLKYLFFKIKVKRKRIQILFFKPIKSSLKDLKTLQLKSMWILNLLGL